jgi:MFS family permease
MMAPVRSALQGIDQILRPQGRVFYGWRIVLAGVGIHVLVSAFMMQSYGAYVVMLHRDFGWSKTLLAGAFSMARVESGILGPLQGWLIDRFGPRAILRIGVVAFGLGFASFSQIDSLLGFYVTFFLIALGSSLGGFVTVIVALVNWFDRHRAKALALSQMGFALGGLSVPLIILALESFGWRATALASGVLIIAVGLPLAQVFRHRPEDHGEAVDGLPNPLAQSEPESEPGALVDRSGDSSAREAMRTRAFWLISLGHASALLVVSAVMVHLVPHLTESLGYSLATAGWIVALMTTVQMIGLLSGGYLGDRFDKRIIVVICMVAHASGLLLVAHATSLAMVLGFALLHGWAWGTRGPLMVAMRADYFGASSFGTIMGFSSLIVMMGMMAGPLVAGYMADRSGNYESGLSVLAIAALLGSVFFLLATPPERSRTTPTQSGDPVGLGGTRRSPAARSTLASRRSE